ncbi:MAG: hypothetical protein U5K36_13175 [Roseovarius sp.]|nr:hypothetical protein [Roseovarius sp.]
MVLSTSSTEAGPSATSDFAASIAARKVGKWQTPKHAGSRGQGREFDLDGSGGGERPLRADQKMGEVYGRVAGHQRVDIVAPHPALHLREARGDLLGLARAQIEHLA